MTWFGTQVSLILKSILFQHEPLQGNCSLRDDEICTDKDDTNAQRQERLIRGGSH